MAHFLIYIPGKKTADPQNLVDAGLSDLHEGHSMVEVRGPDGKGGMLVSWSKNFEWESGWIWKPAVPFDGLEAGRYWYGMKEGSPPTPQELQLNYRKIGKNILLDDGQQWVIPYAQELPSNLQLADNGSLKFEINRKFHDFWIESENWKNRLLNEGYSSLEDMNAVALFVIKAIKLNYRLTLEVISDLQLFTKENLLTSIMTICDLKYGQ